MSVKSGFSIFEEREWQVAWVFGLLLVIFSYVLPATAGFSKIPGDLGDARFNSVILEHGFRWISGLEQSLWSPGFFYPFKDTLAFSDNHFGTVVFYSFARAVGLDREGAYLFWMAFGIILNYASMFYVLRKIGFGVWGAVCGALLFSAGLPTAAKLGHAQLTYRFASPLAVLFFWQWLGEGRPRSLLLGALFVVWQFFCSIYLGVFLFYLLFFLLLARLLPWVAAPVAWRQMFDRSRWVALRLKDVLLLVCLAVAVLSLLAMLHKYAEVGRAYGISRSASEVFLMLPQPGSYLINDQSYLYRWLGSFVQVPMRHEHQMFIGVGAGLFFVSGLVLLFRRNAPSFVRAGGFAVGALVLLTLNFGGYSFYSFVIDVPGLSAVRAVARIVLIMLLPAAVVVAFSVDWFVSRSLRVDCSGLLRGLFVVVLLSGEIVLMNYYNTPVSAWKAREDYVVSKLSRDIPKDSVLFVEPGTQGMVLLYELDAMIVAQNKGMPTLNGYSGSVPTQEWLSAVFTDCPDPAARVRAYEHFYPGRHGEQWVRDVMARVVSVSEEPCVQGRVVVDDLPLELIPGIRLKPSLMPDGRVQVIVSNVSKAVFPSTTRRGPLRLSWRFIPRGAEPSSVSWDAHRLDMNKVISPGASVEILFDPELSFAVSDGRLEVSIVQEGVRWLHDFGMEVGVLDLRKDR